MAIRRIGEIPEVSGLVVEVRNRDLRPEDLQRCGWAGTPLHLESVAEQLRRAETGEVDYVVVIVPNGEPVGMGGVDFTRHPGAGTLYQLAVRPSWQSCGIGTLLVRLLEQRTRRRGLATAELSVELDNPRARALYERLGYEAYGEAPEAWDEQRPDGSVVRYETVCATMRRAL
jgi:ribosomal protein S18 acetylase RimI-like enzyme